MGCVVIWNTDFNGQKFFGTNIPSFEKEKPMKHCLNIYKIFSTLPKKKTNKSCEHSKKNHRTGKLDSERKNCGQQYLLVETVVRIDYVSSYRSLLNYK